ncbi:MAG: hypothetical protein ACYDCO_25160 [Armatimonadota bacterium]
MSLARRAVSSRLIYARRSSPRPAGSGWDSVVAQRADIHGKAVKGQWEPFAHLSDDEAGSMFEMTLNLP